MKYTTKDNKGGIATSKLVVRLEKKKPHHYNECCAVCPNRLKKMTRVEACQVMDFKINSLVFTDEATVKCDHYSIKTEAFLNTFPSEGDFITR